MTLWTDLIYPAQLTGYARASLESYELSLGTLGRWLPNRITPDIVARFVVGRTGLQPVASFRGYDAETPLGEMPGLQRVTIELPPIGEKLRISEYDQLRMRGNLEATQILDSVETVTDQIVHNVSDRMEVERGYALEYAALNIQDNGFIQTGNWNRRTDHNFDVTGSTAGAPAFGAGVPTWTTQSPYWDNPSSATPLLNMTDWRLNYLLHTGQPAGAFVVSTRIMTNLARTNEFRQLAATLVGEPDLVSQQVIQQVLAAHGLPPLFIYDRQANIGGTVRHIMSDDKVYVLPAPVDPNDWAGTKLGASFYGQTLESDEPEYGIEPAEMPGIVAAVWKTQDPIAAWVHVNAIGLPVLANADLSMAIQVLESDGS